MLEKARSKIILDCLVTLVNDENAGQLNGTDSFSNEKGDIERQRLLR